MSTGYQIIDVEQTNPGLPYNSVTQNDRIIVNYTAPTGKRIVGCWLSSIGGMYGDTPPAPYGGPGSDGSTWHSELGANMAYYDEAPTPPDVTNTFRYIVVDA